MPVRPSLESCRQRGTTLIEQVMVIAIVAVLAGIAMPSMRQLMSRNRLQMAQTDFIAALKHTRETAVISGKRTVFCPSTDGSHCSNETHWGNGWLLGHDGDNDHQPDDGPLYTGAGYGNLVVTGSAGRHYVRFQPDGSASGSNLTLTFCRPGEADHALSVLVANSGRVRGAPANAQKAAECAQLR